MIRFLLSFLILINIAYADSQRYYIQLGSFKQLQVLEKSIDSLPYDLREHVTIVRLKNWYIPFAYYTSQKSSLYSKVSSYKNYFPDAYINHSSSLLNHPVIHDYSTVSDTQTSYSTPPEPINSYTNSYSSTERVYSAPVLENEYQNVAISEEDNTLAVTTSTPTVVSTPTPSTPIVAQPLITAKSNIFTPDIIEGDSLKRYNHFNKKMLSGQTYYLAYKSTSESPNLLIKVIFENHQVTYQPIIGDMEMTKANYLVDDNKLYMFANEFTKNGAYSTLEEHRNNHFLVSSWVGDKKLNTLRYYYRLNDAKEYLGIKKSNGLASALEEGNFDDSFLSE